MNRCDECKHKDSCVCVPYGCECFELDLAEHDKQIRSDTIDEYHLKLLNCKTDKVKSIHDAEIWVEFKRQSKRIAEQLKGAEND